MRMRAAVTVMIRRASAGELDEVLAIDDDASTLYAEAGLPLGITRDHPFAVAERARWARALAEDRVLVAVDGRPIGIAVLGTVDGAPYLDQLSVRREAMGRGVGRALLERALAWAPWRPLWLTTYDHLPWNRPFYERAGFALVPEEEWGPGIRAIVAEQRAHLPDPHARVVMRAARG